MVRLTHPRLLFARSVVAASVVAASVVSASVVACGGASPPSAPESAADPGPAASARAATSTNATASAQPPSAASVGSRKPLDTAAIYTRLESGLRRCYELGKKATPEMTDGKLTLNASIDASGKTTCVIPSDHTGLTQDVEDCMSARFSAETFDQGAAWSTAVPIVLRGGVLARGETSPDAAVIDSVETIRMPDAFEAVEALEPALQACIRGDGGGTGTGTGTGGVRSLLVGARVGADGRTQCALSTSGGGRALPGNVAECTSSVLRAAGFPPPKRGSGIVLVPINVVGSK